MITTEDIYADLHTHTISSLHAYSTVWENMKCAESAGMEVLAITDHYFNLGDAITNKNDVGRIVYMSKTINPVAKEPVYVVGGAEFNLNQNIPSGKDYHDKLMKAKWRLVGLHTWFVNTKKVSLEELYCLFKCAAFSRNYTAFAHIERELQDVEQGK